MRLAVKRSCGYQLWLDTGVVGGAYYAEWVERDEVDVWDEETRRMVTVRGFDGLPAVVNTYHRRYFESGEPVVEFTKWCDGRLPHE